MFRTFICLAVELQVTLSAALALLEINYAQYLRGLSLDEQVPIPSSMRGAQNVKQAAHPHFHHRHYVTISKTFSIISLFLDFLWPSCFSCLKFMKKIFIITEISFHKMKSDKFSYRSDIQPRRPPSVSGSTDEKFKPLHGGKSQPPNPKSSAGLFYRKLNSLLSCWEAVEKISRRFLEDFSKISRRFQRKSNSISTRTVIRLRFLSHGQSIWSVRREKQRNQSYCSAPRMPLPGNKWGRLLSQAGSWAGTLT